METEFKTLGELFGIPDTGERFVDVKLDNGNICHVDTHWKVRLRKPNPTSKPQHKLQTELPPQSPE